MVYILIIAEKKNHNEYILKCLWQENVVFFLHLEFIKVCLFVQYKVLDMALLLKSGNCRFFLKNAIHLITDVVKWVFLHSLICWEYAFLFCIITISQ